MNTPNKLTVLRALLVPVLIFFLLVDVIPSRFLWALCIFIIASVTDHLDGQLARKNNQITDFGKFLDPLADKMLVMSTFICFVELGVVNAVPVIIILMREFIVTSIRLVAMTSGKVIAANIWGKVKTVTQITCIITILLSQCMLEAKRFKFNFNFNFISQLNEILVWIAVAVTLYSGYLYVKDNFNFIKTTK